MRASSGEQFPVATRGIAAMNLPAVKDASSPKIVEASRHASESCRHVLQILGQRVEDVPSQGPEALEPGARGDRTYLKALPDFLRRFILLLCEAHYIYVISHLSMRSSASLV